MVLITNIILSCSKSIGKMINHGSTESIWELPKITKKVARREAQRRGAPLTAIACEKDSFFAKSAASSPR